jgi:hypothetical protein
LSRSNIRVLVAEPGFYLTDVLNAVSEAAARR